MTLKESLIQDLYRLLEMLGILVMDKYRELLYQTAYDSIGRDVSPQDKAPDELACVESLCKIIQRAFPELRFPTLVGTRELYAYLETSPSWKATQTPQFGNIILSITGTGNGKVKNGHTGIIGKNWIMSNDSRSGTWEANYLPDSWNRYFAIKGGMFTHYYKRV